MMQEIQNVFKAIRDWANGKFQKRGNYALIENTGYSLGLNIDSDYIMTIELKNADGTVMSAKSIDFPIESMVVNASYAEGELTLTLQNGNILTVDISAIVSGLVNDTFTIAGIDMKDNITKEELLKELGVPQKTSELTNDSGFITKYVNDLENYYKKAETYSQNDADEKFAGKMDIPTKLSELTNDAGYAKTSSPAFTGTPTTSSITDASPDQQIAPVGYVKESIRNIPFPMVGSGMLTIQQNGEFIGGFNANSSENKEVDIDAVKTEGDSSKTTVTFEQASIRANVEPGDSLEVAFAKLSKFCADLKPVAFTGKYSDLSGTPDRLANPNFLHFTGGAYEIYDGSEEKYVNIPSGTNNLLANTSGTWLDAVQGKVLNDKINQINSDLGGFRCVTVYYKTATGTVIADNLDQFKGSKPFIFNGYNLHDRSLYPYIPVIYPAGIYNVSVDKKYRTILLADSVSTNDNNIYFARLFLDEAKWYKIPMTEL